MEGRNHKKIAYKAKVFNVIRAEYGLPTGKRFVGDYVDFPNVVTMIPVLGDKIIMVREFRTSVKRWLVGLPAGKVGKGEKLLSAARREVAEETGFAVKSIRLLFKSFASPGYSNEVRYFYLVECGKKGPQHLDKDEVIKIMPMTLARALRMIKTGGITDGKTIMGLLYYAMFVKPKK